VQPTYTEKIIFVEKTFGKGSISRDGNDIAVSCPICKDTKKKKLSVSLSTWNFHCWVCGTKGKTLLPVLRKFASKDVINFYRQSFLNQKFDKDDTNDVLEEQKFEYPDEFVPLVSVLDSKNPNIRSVISYLRSRSLTEADFYKFRVGVTPDGRDPRRAYFISLDDEGEENYFVSRSIDDHSRQRYVNSNVDKMKIIFNECDIDWDEPIVLVEGVFDQIRLGRNSVCLLGSSLPESSYLFKKLVANEASVILALDSDVITKSNKIADILISYGCDVKIFPLLGEKDVGSMTKEQIEKSMNELVPWSSKTSLLSKISMIRSGTLF
jgi:DNA primase